MSAEDITKLERLGLRNDYDLRTTEEARARPDVMPRGVHYTSLNVLADATSVKAEYLQASFDEMQKQYGTIERYFSDGLGIDAARQKALRDLFLE